MKRLLSGRRGAFALGFAVALALELIAHLIFPMDEAHAAPGPIPTCFGRTATHVLVDGPVENYQSWVDAGVVVVDTHVTGADLTGTPGTDVLVALVSSRGNGIISTPFYRKVPSEGGATAGDFICQKSGPSIVYGTMFADHIMTAGGDDVIYAGGCRFEPPEHRSDHDGRFSMCDEVWTGTGSDSTWGSLVPEGYHQHIVSQGDQDHNYVGKGLGQVEVIGGDPGRSACSGEGDHEGHCKGGDHIHPCGKNTIRSASDPRSRNAQIIKVGIEYVGSEAAIGKPREDRFDPCAYDEQTLG